jgi:hypothetical protein
LHPPVRLSHSFSMSGALTGVIDMFGIGLLKTTHNRHKSTYHLHPLCIFKHIKTYDMIQGIYNTHITYLHVHGGMDHSDLSFSRHLSKDFSKGRSASADLRLL